MTDSFAKLKAILDEKGTLSDEEIAAVVKEHGEMSDEETMQLSVEIHERKRASEATVTMEQFLEANKVLDNAEPDSDEYKKAQEIVDKFLTGS